MQFLGQAMVPPISLLGLQKFIAKFQTCMCKW